MKKSAMSAPQTSNIRDRNFAIILQAAKQEFAANGLNGARMQTIADQAGLPKANVHYYFKTKESLYLAVLDDIIDRWNAFQHMSVDDDPADALDRFIRSKVQFSFEDPVSSRLFASEILQGAPHLGGYFREELRPWVKQRTDVINGWIAAGKMQAIDPMQLIFLIWSSTQHYADFEPQVLAIMNKSRYTAKIQQQVSDFLSQFILSGCGLKSPESPS